MTSTDVVKSIVCFIVVLAVAIGFYLYFNAPEAKYYVIKLNTGEYSWVKKYSFGTKYSSMYTYSTSEMAQAAASRHRGYNDAAKTLEETPLSELDKLENETN